jgi:hypothetical protein
MKTGTPVFTIAVSYATGVLVISVVMVAIIVLVFALWRRSGSAGATLAVSRGPRTDTHAIAALPALFSPAAPDPGAPAQAQAPPASRSLSPAPAPAPAEALQDRRHEVAPLVAPAEPQQPAAAASAPHPSGLGAAELAAIVESGLASLRTDVDTLGTLIESVASASAVPEDLPARPAAQQVALIDQMSAMIASDLERAHRLAETVAVDVEGGNRARSEVHGELARIGLPAGFFVSMDTTAADLAVDLVRAQMAVERLARRFESLSSLYSSVRPTVDLLADLGETLRGAAAVADPWRRSPESVDLVQRTQVAQVLPG